MSEMPARLAGWGASAGQGLRDAAFIMRNGLRPQDVTKLDQPNRGFATNIPGLAPAGSRAADTVDAAMELPMRALAAADAFWRGTFTGGHLAAEAIARATRNNAGKPPSAEQIAKAMLDPDVIARADAMAARSVLQESRHAAEGLNKYIQGLPDGVQAVVSTVMPYIRTPFNIVAQGVGMTPLGLISLAQDIRAGKPTREINQRVGRLALGTMAMGWAGWQNMQGNLTGPYPENEAERSTLPPGWRPWSYKVTVPGAGTQYVPIGVLGPVAVPMVASILMTEGAKRGQPFDLDRAAKVAQGIGQFAEDQTFLRSLADLSEALEKGGNTMMNYVERLSTQASPHIVGGGGVGRRIQEILGMPQRDPEGVIEALMATHPALAGLVPPKRDVLGRQQQSGPSGALAVQPFVRSSQERDAPVLRAYRQAKVSLPRGAPKDYDPGDGSGRRPLSRRQREAWKVAFGQALQSEWSNAGSPSDPAELRRVTETARERALSTATGR
ncbi:MAG: hypothetical protein IT480_19285 [Gammaproteobacteria bacterium]|nr:hypothetical protein [Gammaproteobacteria bacterium]